MAKPLILASGSPRRREILEMLKIPFSVEIPTRFVEFSGSNVADPEQLVAQNAMGKAQDVAETHPDSLVLGVDTVVFCEGRILEKPKNSEDAAQMLHLLQGKKHQVYTGHCLLETPSQKMLCLTDTSTVEFLPMTSQQIEDYIATGEPMDKAGAYAIQGLGAKFIKRIEGDFFGVMGLSVAKFCALLEGIDPPTSI